MNDPATLLLTFACLLLMAGILGAAEIALAHVHKGQLETEAEAGSQRARKILAWMDHPHPFLSALRFSCLVLAGVVGGMGWQELRGFGSALALRLPGEVPQPEWVATGILALVGLGVSYALVEALPRRLAIANPERAAILLAGLASLSRGVWSPVTSTVGFVIDRLFRVFGFHAKPRRAAVTEDEVNELIEQGLQSGVFNKAETEMVAGVLELDQLPVTALMTPRPKIVFLNYDDPEEVNWRKIVSSGHSYFPVFQGNRDQVVGMVAVKALWAHSAIGLSTDLKNLMVPPLLVPESMTAIQLLEGFKKSGKHIALITNEFGAILGLVTLIDVLEAIVGDLPAQGRRDAPAAKQREDGSWLIDATLPIADAKSLLELDEFPHENVADFKTLGGFVVTHFGRIPAAGDFFQAKGWRFEVVDMDRNRVDKLLVSRGSGAISTVSAKTGE